MSEALLAGRLASHLAVATAFALLFGVATALPPRPANFRWSAPGVPVVGVRLTLVALLLVGSWGIFDTRLLVAWLEWFAAGATALVTGGVLLLPQPHPRWDSWLVAVSTALVVGLSVSVGIEQVAGISWPVGLWSGFDLLGTGVLRSAEALVYPVVCLLIIRRLVQGGVEQAVLDAGGTERMSAALARALPVLDRAMDRELLAHSGLRLISHFLRARYGVLIVGPDPDGGLVVQAAVDPQGGPEPARLPLRSQVLPGLTASLVLGRTKVLPTDNEFAALKEALGLKASGPGMLAPLQLGGGRKAGMLLFASLELGGWSAADVETFEAWANSMSHRIGGSAERAASSEPPEGVETLKAELRLALEELAEVKSQSQRQEPVPVGSLIAPIEGRADVIASVETAVAQVAGSLEERGQSLHLDLAGSLPSVSGDPDELRQILVTLIENAIQASPAGAVIPVSALATDSAGGAWVSLSVSDSGGGIPPEDLGRIFHSPEPGRGTESGLARVKQLAEGMGGRVWVGSEVGGGSTVTVLIPARPG